MSKNGTSMNLKGQYKTELIFELVLPDKINLQKYNKNNVDPPHKQKWKDTKIPIWPLNSLVIISNQKTHDFQTWGWDMGMVAPDILISWLAVRSLKMFPSVIQNFQSTITGFVLADIILVLDITASKVPTLVL